MSVTRIDAATVAALLERLYLGGGAPRDEERKKAEEVAGLLALVAAAVSQPVPRGKARTLVDAAAGHGYVGLCAAALLGWRRVVAIERDPERIERVRAAARKLDFALELDARVSSLEEAPLPAEADLVVALHACGPATDLVLGSAVGARARWILCAPCCYGAAVAGWREAHGEGGALGLPDDAVVRGRYAQARIEGARLDRLHAAGYEAALVPFVAPTVSPHHHVFRARRGGKLRNAD